MEGRLGGYERTPDTQNFCCDDNLLTILKSSQDQPTEIVQENKEQIHSSAQYSLYHPSVLIEKGRQEIMRYQWSGNDIFGRVCYTGLCG